jgi:CheY-like chemotaxis protein
MEVVAFSVANDTWRWRIIDANGKTVVESDRTFHSIAIALAFGQRHVEELTRKTPQRRPRRGTSGPEAATRPRDAGREAVGDDRRQAPERLLDGLCVLLVENDRNVRAMMALALEVAGARVSECGDGMQALEALRSAVPDVLVMGLNLPGANGLSIIRTIRQLEDPDARAVPALVLSGNVEEHCGADHIVREAGFTDCLKKPVRIERLVRTVGRLAGRAA